MNAIDIAPSLARRQRARELDVQIARAHDELHAIAEQADVLAGLVADRLRGPRGSRLLRVVVGVLCLPPFLIAGGAVCWFLGALVR
jgi:hypothetical protein